MKINQYYEAGDKFDYVATGEVGYHEVVVVESLVGVTTKEGKAGDVIACDAVGVFALAKKSGEAIAQGKTVYITDDGVSATGEVVAGIAWAAAVANDETCLVKINA